MSSPAGRPATLLAFDYGEKRIGVAVGNRSEERLEAALALLGISLSMLSGEAGHA